MKTINKMKPSALFYCTLSIALLPFVPSIFQYRQNIENYYLWTWHILAFSAVLSALLAIVFFLARTLAKSDFAAFIFYIIVFIALSATPTLVPVVLKMPPQGVDTLTVIIHLLCLFAIALVIAYKLGNMKCLQSVNNLIIDKASGTRIEPLLAKVRIPPMTAAVAIALFALLKPAYDIIVDIGTVSVYVQLLLCGGILLAVILAYLCYRKRDKLTSNVIPALIASIIGVVLIQNIIGIIGPNFLRAADDSSYKKTFAVDTSLTEQPNIYWFHCDAMLGFDAMQQFFGDSQGTFTTDLGKRGFWIGEDAAFEANHQTQFAVPVLMNPYFYDRVMSWEFDPDYAQAVSQNNDWPTDSGRRVKMVFPDLRDAAESNETVAAFNSAGFNTSTILYSGRYYPLFLKTSQLYCAKYEPVLVFNTQQTDEIYMEYINRFQQYICADIIYGLFSKLILIPDGLQSPINRLVRQSLNMDSVLSTIHVDSDNIFSDLTISEQSMQSLNGYNNVAKALRDTFSSPAPRFTVIDFYMAHVNFRYDENGNYYTGNDEQNPVRYPAHHIFSAKTLLKYVDIILETDPDAVIVLVADHGFNSVPMNVILDTFDCTEEEALVLLNQVMCAVRLPDERLTQETKEILSDPRNISRYLINEFVGTNYEYIPTEYRQIYTGLAR